MELENPSNNNNVISRIDPIILDELMEDLSNGSGDPIKWGHLEEEFPNLVEDIQNFEEDHDYQDDLYIDITNEFKLYNPTGPNIDEQYTVLRDKSGKTIVVDDVTYKARPYTFSEEVFGGEMVDKSLLLRGKTKYEKYVDKKNKNLLGIKRKRYHVYENPEGKLEQELDKDVVYLRTKTGKMYVKGEDPPNDYDAPLKEFFDPFS